MYWNDARNVLQDLHQFQALYIQYSGCVWSECSVDNYDDDGENRDGDEYWYQYRTQPFCANAAYSLYGILKNRVVLPWDHCSRGTYINSFFTYGGADTLLEAYDGEITTPSTYFDNYEQNADDDYSSSYYHSNAVCYAEDDEDGNSGDDDANNGYSATMGCSADGKKFVAALFKGQVCEGQLFQETIDSMDGYNRVIRRNFQCRQIYSRLRDGAAVQQYYDQLEASYNNNNERHRTLTVKRTNHTISESHLRTKTQQERSLENNNDDDNNAIATPDIPAWTILSQSWACDVSLYPDGCPDPYRLKRRYDAVLNAAAKGRNGALARWHYRIARFLRMASVVAVLSGIVLYMSAYWVSRREAFKTTGFCTTICSDLKEVCVQFAKFLRKCCRAVINVITGKTRRQRKAAATEAAKSPSSAKSRSPSSNSSRKSKRRSRSRKKSKAKESTLGDYFAFS